MSGPEEVERLILLAADGIRKKMMRPKCLERTSWIQDSTPALLRRVEEEDMELHQALFSAKRAYLAFGDSPYTTERLRAVFDETSDLQAFGSMVVDPRRLERLGSRVVA